MFTSWMEDDEFGFIRVNSKLVCIKPGGDMRKLLINHSSYSSQVLMTKKNIGVISKKNK